MRIGSRDHLIPNMPFPIGSPLERSLYLQPFSRYWALVGSLVGLLCKIISSWVDVLIRLCLSIYGWTLFVCCCWTYHNTTWNSLPEYLCNPVLKTIRRQLKHGYVLANSVMSPELTDSLSLCSTAACLIDQCDNDRPIAQRNRPIAQIRP